MANKHMFNDWRQGQNCKNVYMNKLYIYIDSQMQMQVWILYFINGPLLGRSYFVQGKI